MWAVSPIPSSPSWPPSATTKQPSEYRPATVTVSAKPRRQSRTRNKDLNYYDDDDDDNEVESSAQAAAKSEANSDVSWELKLQESDGSPLQGMGGLGRAVNNSVNSKEEKQISGSDVLWALQKATTARKPKAKKKEANKSNRENRKKRIVKGEEDSVDYSNVKALEIRGDWGTRLDDLEKRLHELTDI